MKFKVGDLVKIHDELPVYMAHFHKGKHAVIKDKLHGEFGLMILGEGYSAWYPPKVLDLISPGNRETFESHCARMFKLVQF